MKYIQQNPTDLWKTQTGDVAHVPDLIRQLLLEGMLVEILESVVGRIVIREVHFLLLRDENVAGLDVEMHEAHGMDVAQALGGVEQQSSQFHAAQRFPSDRVRQRTPVAVLVLDYHVVVFRPRRVVAHHVLMFA